MKASMIIPRTRVYQLINSLVEICDPYEEDQKRSDLTAASVTGNVWQNDPNEVDDVVGMVVVQDSRAAPIHDAHLLGRGFILDGLLVWQKRRLSS